MGFTYQATNQLMKIINTTIVVISLTLASSNVLAEVKLESEGMKIYGQSELPKVLYIVPWKQREAGGIDTPTSNSLASDILQPIDPEIFRRQIRYHELMTQHQADNKD